MRSEQQIDIRIAFPDFLRNMRLLNHAAAYAQHKLFVLKPLVLHGADYAENAIFRIFTHRTGI